jgi:hypothetical protein
VKKFPSYTREGYVNRIVDFLESRGWYERYPECPGAYTMRFLESHDHTMVCKISVIDGTYNNMPEDFYPTFAAWVCTQNNPHFPRIVMARSLARYGLFMCVMEKLQHVDYERMQDVSWRMMPVDSLPEAERKAYYLINRKYASFAGSKLGEAINKLLKTFGPVTDLHSGNIMKRADGTLVITDPYSRAPGASDDCEDSVPVYSVTVIEDTEISLRQTAQEECDCTCCRMWIALKHDDVKPVRNLGSILRSKLNKRI